MKRLLYRGGLIGGLLAMSGWASAALAQNAVGGAVDLAKARQQAQQRILEEGLPDVLAQRLALGR